MNINEMLQKYNSISGMKPLRELMIEPGRFENFSLREDGLLLDCTRVRMDELALANLFELARRTGVEEQRHALFSGEPVNNTEERPVLHMAIRTTELLEHVGPEETAKVNAARAKMLSIAGDLFTGHLPGDRDRRVRNIIHVGIGGSLLGPQLICEALDEGDSAVRVYFLGSVDAGKREVLINQLDPAETVVVMVSKSFTTGDTLLHGRRLRDWLNTKLGEQAARRRLFAVTSQTERASAFGMDEAHMLYFPEFVGGRYSLWTPVSLAAAALIGPGRFEELLSGAADMDRHFQQAPLEQNLPVLFALVGVWHRNICGYPAWGVMPYDYRLRLLPAFLQQLVMESNGKSVARGGSMAEAATAPVVFGETGTEAQHSLFQAMHQGSDIVPLNFVAVIRPAHTDREAHDELLANLLAQVTSLAVGRTAEQTRAGLGDVDPALLAHRTFAGNRPSELIMLDELSPAILGRLIALYEHKVFVESVIWDINAFDQWGVELGKTLAPGIQGALEGGQADAPGLGRLLQHISEIRRQ